MSLKRQEKHEAVEKLTHLLANSSASILTDYRGLKVAEITELRRKLRDLGAEYRVVKNTLTARAAKSAGIEGLEQWLEGPVAIAFGTQDPAAVAKALNDFARTHKVFAIKAGVLEGQVIGPESVQALAALPSREELLARVVGGFQAPISGLVSVLQGNIRQLVYVVNAIQEKQAEGGEAA